jgi:hypothetical protein
MFVCPRANDQLFLFDYIMKIRENVQSVCKGILASEVHQEPWLAA